MPFVFARMAAYRSVLGAVLLITLVVGTVLAALAVYDGRALHQATYQRLAGSDTSITLTASTTGPSQFATQTSALRATAGQVLGSVPYTLDGTLWSDSLALPVGTAPGPAGQQLVLLAGFQDLRAHATLTAGNWPVPVTGPVTGGSGPVVPAALPIAVAADLKLTVGSELTLTDTGDHAVTRIRITGLYRYRPGGAADSYWDQNQIGPAGEKSSPPFTTFGPIAVDPGAFTAAGIGASQATWDVQPSITGLASLDPAVIGQIFNTLTTAFQQASWQSANQVSTTLPAQLVAVEDDRSVTQAELEAIALGLLILTIAALVVSARPLAAQREPETYLLTLRGRARRQAVLANLGESCALGGAAFLAAAPAGAGVATLLGRDGPQAASTVPGPALVPPSAAWLAAAAVAVLCAIVVMAATTRKQGSVLQRPRGRRPARLAGAARAGGDIAVLGLAVVAYWQLRTLPLVSSTSAAPTVNLLAAVAPALALIAGALLSLRLLPPLANLADRIAGRGRRAGAALTAWQISRRPYQHSGTALLLVLAVAAGAFSFSQHATWQRSIADQSTFTAGAQVRVDLDAAAAVAAAATPAGIADGPSVLTATPALRLTGYDGSTVLALDSSTAPATVLLRSDQYQGSSAGLWAALWTGAPVSPALPGRPARIQLTATIGSAARTSAAGGLASAASPAAGLADVTLTLTAEDGDGEFFTLPARPLAADGRPHTLLFPIAAGAAYPLRPVGLALNYQVPATQTGADVLAVTGLAVSDQSTGAFSPADLNLGSWTGLTQSVDLENAIEDAKAATAAGIATSPVGAARLAAAAAGSTWAGWSQQFDPGYGQDPDVDGNGNLLGYTRVQAGVSFSAAPTGVLPVLATAAYLQNTGLGLGSTTQIGADGRQIEVKIVGAVANFPTVGTLNFVGGLIVDEAALQHELLSLGLPLVPTTEWWLRTAGGAVPTGLPADAVVTTVRSTQATLLGDPLSAVAQQGQLALGLAAGILAIAALWTAIVAARRERRGQEAVLAALGLSSRRQALFQCAERIGVGIPAALAGLAIGTGLARLLLPDLILSPAATIPVPSITVAIAWWPAAALAAAVVLGPLLAVAAGTATRPDPAAQLRLMEEL